MKCPNCGSALDLSEWWQDLMTSRWGGIACDNCPAVIRIKPSISARRRDSRRRDSVLSAILFVTVLGLVSTLILVTMNLLILIPSILTLLFSIGVFVARSDLRMAGSATHMEQPDGEAEILRMRPTCQRCGAALDFEGALTCRKCGFEVAEAEILGAGVVGTCIVCNSNLGSNDDLLFCPHCGRPAHKVHMLEWLHVKNRCPSCGEHIDEREISKQLLK